MNNQIVENKLLKLGNIIKTIHTMPKQKELTGGKENPTPFQVCCHKVYLRPAVPQPFQCPHRYRGCRRRSIDPSWFVIFKPGKSKFEDSNRSNDNSRKRLPKRSKIKEEKRLYIYHCGKNCSPSLCARTNPTIHFFFSVHILGRQAKCPYNMGPILPAGLRKNPQDDLDSFFTI